MVSGWTAGIWPRNGSNELKTQCGGILANPRRPGKANLPLASTPLINRAGCASPAIRQVRFWLALAAVSGRIFLRPARSAGFAGRSDYKGGQRKTVSAIPHVQPTSRNRASKEISRGGHEVATRSTIRLAAMRDRLSPCRSLRFALSSGRSRWPPSDAMSTSAQAGDPTAGSKATNSRAARDDAAQSIPYDRLPAEMRSRVAAVVNNPSIFRRLPIATIDCDPDLYLLLLRNPEIVIDIWQIMGITNMALTRDGAEPIPCRRWSRHRRHIGICLPQRRHARDLFHGQLRRIAIARQDSRRIGRGVEDGVSPQRQRPNSDCQPSRRVPASRQRRHRVDRQDAPAAARQDRRSQFRGNGVVRRQPFAHGREQSGGRRPVGEPPAARRCPHEAAIERTERASLGSGGCSPSGNVSAIAKSRRHAGDSSSGAGSPRRSGFLRTAVTPNACGVGDFAPFVGVDAGTAKPAASRIERRISSSYNATDARSAKMVESAFPRCPPDDAPLPALPFLPPNPS